MAIILEQAERAAVRWEIIYTNFFSPPVVADALVALEQMSDIAAVAWGGYPQAERCRIAMGREDVMLAAREDPSQLPNAVAALDCRGNFMFDPAMHRDFLGAILGTGVVREKVGVSSSRAGGDLIGQQPSSLVGNTELYIRLWCHQQLPTRHLFWL